MIAQDLTKFMMVTVLLGIILAIAIFRPEILPAEADQPRQVEETALVLGQEESEIPSPGELEQRERELDQRETGLDQRQYELDQRQAELGEREAGLNQRQVELDEREAGLDQRQAELDRREARLDQRQVGLDEREAKLEEQMAALRAWEDRLIKQDSLLDEERARLREKGASLAEWEQKLEERQRLSVVAIAVSGLLSVPSVVVLVALMRQSQQTPKGEAQRAQAPEAYHREQTTQHGRVATEALALTYSDDGRDKESVDHFV